MRLKNNPQNAEATVLHQCIICCSKHSFESQLIQTVHDFSEALDNKLETDVIITDFSTAFDKVAHRRLLSKLHHYGIRGNVMVDFVPNRAQTMGGYQR